MKKTIITLATLAIMATSFQANAVVGGVVALAGGGATIALSGLGAFGAGSFLCGATNSCSVNGDGLGLLLAVVGVILLDGDNGQEIQFKKMSEADLYNMNLTQDEARAYNENSEELTQAFKMVSSDLTKESKVEDAKKLWEEQEAILGTDTINAARKVLAHALNKQ